MAGQRKIRLVTAAVGGLGRRQDRTVSTRQAQRAVSKAPNFKWKAGANSGRNHQHYPNDLEPNLEFQDELFNADNVEEPVEPLFRRNRESRASERRRSSENWVNTEDILAELMVNRSTHHVCHCTTTREVKVRHIGLESYEVRTIKYCHCALSTKGVFLDGFFPATPRMPHTVFAVHLLRVLHAQCVRGPLSRLAWGNGLHRVLEEEYNMVLPNFARAVSDFG
jgi:hypothetical protein